MDYLHTISPSEWYGSHPRRHPPNGLRAVKHKQLFWRGSSATRAPPRIMTMGFFTRCVFLVYKPIVLGDVSVCIARFLSKCVCLSWNKGAMVGPMTGTQHLAQSAFHRSQSSHTCMYATKPNTMTTIVGSTAVHRIIAGLCAVEEI